MVQTPWLIRGSSGTKAQRRLFCFPYAGGGASIYRTWGKQLPAEIEVCAVQLPGRENRITEPFFTSLPLLVETLAQMLQPYLDLPFCFFGHSLGALVSFELTRYLRKSARPQPLRLFLSAHRAPQVARETSDIHMLPDPQFIEALHKLGGTPRAVLEHEELMQMLLPMLRADFTLYETYVYKAEQSLTCPLVAFGGLADAEVSQEALTAWREQTTNRFELKMFPGGHFFLQEQQDLLLQTLKPYLL